MRTVEQGKGYPKIRFYLNRLSVYKRYILSGITKAGKKA